MLVSSHHIKKRGLNFCYQYTLVGSASVQILSGSAEAGIMQNSFIRCSDTHYYNSTAYFS